MNGKIPKKYAFLLTPFLISGFMTLVVSGITALFSLGFVPALLAKWMGAWGLSWFIAFPTLVVVLPIVKRIVAALIEE